MLSYRFRNKSAIDCIGPGTLWYIITIHQVSHCVCAVNVFFFSFFFYSCPSHYDECKCKVSIDDNGAMRVATRFMEVCNATEGCEPHKNRTAPDTAGQFDLKRDIFDEILEDIYRNTVNGLSAQHLIKNKKLILIFYR